MNNARHQPLTTSHLIREFGPKTALAVAQVTGAEDAAIDRLLDRISTPSLRLSVSPSLPQHEDPERWDGMG